MENERNGAASWERVAVLVRGLVERLVPRSYLAKGLLALSSGQLLSQASTVLVAPVVVRLYTPEEFGVYGVYVTLLGAVSLISSLKYETAIALPKEESEARSVLVLALVVNFTVTALLLLGAILGGRALLARVGATEVFDYLFVVGLSVLLAGAGSTFTAFGIRNKAFLNITQAQVYSSTAFSALQLGLGFLHLGVMGLFLSDLSSRLITACRLGVSALREWDKLVRSAKAARLMEVAKRYRRFPLIAMPQTLLNYACLSLPMFWLSGVYGSEAAGLYLMAQKVVLAPMGIFTAAVAQVFLSVAADLRRNTPGELEPFFMKTLRRLGKGVLPPALVLAISGPWIFGFVFGPEWLLAGTFVRVLAPAHVLGLAVAPLSTVLNVVERQDAMFKFDVVRATLLVLTLVLSRRFGLSVVQFLAAYSGVMSLCYLYLLQIMVKAVRSASAPSRVSA